MAQTAENARAAATAANVTDVRFALVMNGGVSLAVWMGGVTHELDLLRRASASLTPGPSGEDLAEQWAPRNQADRPSYDAWRAVCRQLNVRATIDVVAGTSAGGLNGTLLAKAVASGAPLPPLKELWADHAALRRSSLIRQQDDPAPSVLDGDFFAALAQDQLATMTLDEQCARDVTLLVPATATTTVPRSYSDSAGRRFPLEDHRRLYRFQRRHVQRLRDGANGLHPSHAFEELAPGQPGGTDHFDDTATLARAARASAGFPVAFTPVEETTSLAARRDPGIGGDRPEGRTWLVDGGILDNAPFGPVLREISTQPVDGPWRRAVVYVVPSGRAEEVPVPAVSPTPPAWTSVVGSAVWFPREADFRGDVEAIAEQLRRSERWVGSADELFAGMVPWPPGPDRDAAADAATAEVAGASRALQSRYRQSRTRAGVVDVHNLWVRLASTCPLTGTPTVNVEPPVPSLWVPAPSDDITVGTSAPWGWGTAVADRTLRLLLRHLRTAALDPGALTGTSGTSGDDGDRDGADGADAADGAGGDVAGSALATLSRALQQSVALRDAVEAEIESRLDRLPPAGSPATAPEATLAITEEALEATDAMALLTELVRAGAEAYRAALGLELTAEEIVRRALMTEVVTRAFADREGFERLVDFEFHRLGPDNPSLPVGHGPAPRPVSDWKLWGTHLFHFGAFGRRAWREWDWMWGRLDGASQLLEILAAHLSEEERAAIDGLRTQVVDPVLAAEAPSVGTDAAWAWIEEQLATRLWPLRDAPDAGSGEGGGGDSGGAGGGVGDSGVPGPTMRLLAELRSDREGSTAFRNTVTAGIRVLQHDHPQIPRQLRKASRIAAYALLEDVDRSDRPSGVKGWAMGTGARFLLRRRRAWLYPPPP